MAECMSCALIERRDAGQAPLWDCIYRSPCWDVVHNYDTSLPGWLVLVSRRHIAAIADMTDDEAVELGRLLRRAAKALTAVTGCQKTYLALFAESPDHPHVHFHLIPRMPDLAPDSRGPAVFALMDVPEAERVSEQPMSAIAMRLRLLLEAAATEASA